MSDYMIRATASHDQIRAFAATSADLVEYARACHNTSPVATAALGRTLTGGAMMGTMLKGDNDLLTVQIEGDGPIGEIVVTADSKGHVKGYVGHPQVLLHANSLGKLDVGGAVGHGVLQVIKDMGLKEPYLGSVSLVSGEIADDLTYYFTVSEQVPTSVGLGVLMNRNNTVRRAGGFIIQLMPEASDSLADALSEKIAHIKSVTSLLDEGNTPEDILNLILGDMDLEILEKVPLSFYCGCSKEHYASMLVSLGKKELDTMVADGEPVEVQCHFCGKKYTYSVDELKEIDAKAQMK